MSWTTLILLALAIYVQKAIGPLIVGSWRPAEPIRIGLHLLAVPVLAGLIVVQSVTKGTELTLDARLPALAVAGIAVWRGASFIVVVLLAAAVAAGIRLIF